MESAGARLTFGHAGDRQAGRTAGDAMPTQTEGAGNAGGARGVNRIAIASYTKFKGIDGEAGQAGNAEQGKKPVPVPPAQLIGVNLDVRV